MALREIRDSLLETYASNDAMNQVILASLDRRARRGACAMLSDALSASPNRRVRKFSRGSWSQALPAGGTMFAYMFAHEAHHRGQILMLANQLGYRVLHKTPGVWHWEKLWKQAGLTTHPR